MGKRVLKVFDEQQLIIVNGKMVNGVRVIADAKGVHLVSSHGQSMNPTMAKKIAKILVRAANFALTRGCSREAILNGDYCGPNI